jgi:hypothetical protein
MRSFRPGLGISLVRNDHRQDIGSDSAPPPLINIGAEVRNYSDTMALLECLDLVVTVDTSVGHLADAMGKAVWIPLATSPDWRWLLERDSTP